MEDFNNRKRKNDVVIANGQVIVRGVTGRTQKYDERKTLELNKKVERIVIHSTFVDVNIFTTDSQIVEAHFYGEAEVDERIHLDMQMWNHELIITVHFTSNCYIGCCKFDVTIPHKYFKLINIQTLSANVSVDKDVTTENLEIRTQSGSITTHATFTNAYLRTKNGDVKLGVKAERDIDVMIYTINGDIDAYLNNIKELKIKECEICKNTHKCDPEGYTAHIRFSTIAGDIVIK